ncbi:alpha/beta fold hydrolase [Maribacter sp. MAR_2009_72]|uniref:alpha/beta fold hydrolase n=1 Tax=Maribacter sp. MAR_2009_72 TaxID=1250050 RepID=UPI001199B6DD|nr:alpha/beta hydrolase [Maribacter sp. MAR_2009_72]TVZ16894.1 pimeloyl-ACP methyl ester carboxylesterase [Maribacter sp. MAR_2009_72]
MPVLFKKLIPKLYGLYFNLLVWFVPKKVAQQAFTVFATVRKGRVLPKQQAFLDKAKLDVLSINEHNIQVYHWSGKNETVLLVHGWESNSWRWHKLIEKLQAENYNIIAFDAPAHGYSSGTILHVPLYAATLKEMLSVYTPKVLIGHSMGGMTILYNEANNPNDNVEKMVTIGSPSELHEILDHYKKLLGLSTKVTKTLEGYINDQFGFTPEDFSSPKFVKRNTKKGLVFHDRLDEIAPYHASVAVHKHWNGSELYSTEGFGHSMHQDEVNDKIISFLAE